MREIQETPTVQDIDGFFVWKDLYDSMSFREDRPYVVDGLLICLVEKGESNIIINFKEYQTDKNTVLVLPPQSTLELVKIDPKGKMKGFFIPPHIMADQEVFSEYEFFFHVSKHPYFILDDTKMKELISFHEFINNQRVNITESLLREFDKYLLNALSVKIKSIYQDVELLAPTPSKSNNEIMVDRFYKLLFEHYKEEREVSFYADKLFVTPKHLSSVVKQVLGKPIYFWITYVLLSNIKNQLRATNLTVKEIADDLNFASPSVLGRFFKQHTGMTPIQYREQ